jgi:hypothetical protein
MDLLRQMNGKKSCIPCSRKRGSWQWLSSGQ